jgi:hypothetical protein
MAPECEHSRGGRVRIKLFGGNGEVSNTAAAAAEQPSRVLNLRELPSAAVELTG